MSQRILGSWKYLVTKKFVFCNLFCGKKNNNNKLSSASLGTSLQKEYAFKVILDNNYIIIINPL